MNAIVEDNKIKFPYKIHSGFSTQYIAIELLKNENNISKINMVNDKLMDIDDFDNYLRKIDEERYKI